jgi:hypothetical protein
MVNDTSGGKRTLVVVNETESLPRADDVKDSSVKDNSIELNGRCVSMIDAT